jgi:2-iminobutanoate/2-iminopropanoate deaminase
MTRLAGKLLLIAVLLLPASQAKAESLEYIGKPVRGVPVSQAVKVAKSVFVSGTPAFDGNGKLAVGDFPAQMKQVMDNMTATLNASGAGWDRVVKTNILLIRSGDFAEMSRIYATYFSRRKISRANHGRRCRATASRLPSGNRMRGHPRIARVRWHTAITPTTLAITRFRAGQGGLRSWAAVYLESERLWGMVDLLDSVRRDETPLWTHECCVISLMV